MKSIRDFVSRHREILLYLVFGVLTTVVSKAVQFLILIGGERLLGIADTEPRYNAVRGVALVLQWIAGVLFAFFTNRSWVFTEAEKGVSAGYRQFFDFCLGRLGTLGLEALVNFGIVGLCGLCGFVPFILLGVTVDADVIAVLGAAVIVVITNYFLSKYWIFRRKKADDPGKED